MPERQKNMAEQWRHSSRPAPTARSSTAVCITRADPPLSIGKYTETGRLASMVPWLRRCPPSRRMMRQANHDGAATAWGGLKCPPQFNANPFSFACSGQQQTLQDVADFSASCTLSHPIYHWLEAGLCDRLYIALNMAPPSMVASTPAGRLGTHRVKSPKKLPFLWCFTARSKNYPFAE